jgi:hypothetical protein
MIQANQLNLFPVKGGLSQYYSPGMILNQTNLDYTKHCVVPKAVKDMAYQQGFKSLKFKNRNSVIYHDVDWIAGVNYDDADHYNPDDIENEDEEYDKKTKINSNNKKNSRINSSILILKISKTSFEMQEEKPIQTCMYQTITPVKNNWNIQ